MAVLVKRNATVFIPRPAITSLGIAFVLPVSSIIFVIRHVLLVVAGKAAFRLNTDHHPET